VAVESKSGGNVVITVTSEVIHRDSLTFHREEQEREAGHQEDPRENSMDTDLNSQTWLAGVP
jgi:hypothetical protein